MKIVCSKPSTFFSSDSPLKILDENKNLFYVHPNSTRSITFNLPVGKFYTKNIVKEKTFEPYEQFRKENLSIDPREFKIIIGVNDHKATISPEKKTILIDRKTYDQLKKYKPCIPFLIIHEIAHLAKGGNIYTDKSKSEIVYNAEKECDSVAINWMLSHGYNPTQIRLAAKMLKLNDELRQECVHHSTQNFRR